jgi:hypothetical protein
VLKPPLADEGFAARFDLFACVRVDHIFVVGADLVMQAIERLSAAAEPIEFDTSSASAYWDSAHK